MSGLPALRWAIAASLAGCHEGQALAATAQSLADQQSLSGQHGC
ncbi:MAG TPA: hypothetical protein VMC83_28080 [Streptosporangiaceae bacterium]|nr:hypothetical protein [Streptosporangiaceae bacterium]